MRDRAYCKLKAMPGEPVQILGFLDRERVTADMVYLLNKQGYIIRSHPQTHMTMGEAALLDEEAERTAKDYREENKLDLVVV